MYILAIVLALLTPTIVAQAGQPNSTNNIGSTPAQRHYVTAAQAQTIINASVANVSTHWLQFHLFDTATKIHLC